MSARAAPAATSDLLVRTIAGVVMIAVALIAIVLGGRLFWLLVSGIAIMMVHEWGGLVSASRAARVVALVTTAATLVCASPFVSLGGGAIVAAVAIAALLTGIVGRGLWAGAGPLYALLPALALLLIHDQAAGAALTLWTLAIVWTTDIGAYFAGRAIGGPRLAPVISPNKTWAGLIGGMVAALIVGAILAHVLRLPIRLVAIAALLAAAAQGGDLFESWLKRRAGVKDSGRILPGHGGVLDRLDGVVPVAVIIALLILTGWL